MKTTVLIIITLCLGKLLPAQDTVTMKTGKKQVSEFHLVFHDEFEGTTLNTGYWKVANGVLRDPEQKSVRQWLTADNLEVSNGTLKMWAKRDTLINQEYSVWIKDGMKPFSLDFEFTAAEFESYDRYGYGMYEIRCKIPKGKGLCPAFWMYGENNGVNCEIDVFEFWNQKSLFSKFSKKKLSRVHNMTAHYNGKMSGKSYKGPDFSNDFHVFTVIWDECKIEWFVDGELKRTIHRYKKSKGEMLSCTEEQKRYAGTKENVFPRDQSVSIITNFAIQNNDAKPFETDPFPVAFEIDYIRFYELVGTTPIPAN